MYKMMKSNGPVGVFGKAEIPWLFCLFLPLFFFRFSRASSRTSLDRLKPLVLSRFAFAQISVLDALVF